LGSIGDIRNSTARPDEYTELVKRFQNRYILDVKTLIELKDYTGQFILDSSTNSIINITPVGDGEPVLTEEILNIRWDEPSRIVYPPIEITVNQGSYYEGDTVTSLATGSETPEATYVYEFMNLTDTEILQEYSSVNSFVIPMNYGNKDMKVSSRATNGTYFSPSISTEFTVLVYIPPTNNLMEGLISYYSFDGDALDSVYSEGIVNGASLTTGKIGQCYEFDGIDDYIDLNAPSVTNTYSISGWFTLNDLTSNSWFISGQSSSNPYPDLYYNSGETKFQYRANPSETGVKSTTTPLIGTFYHIVIIGDNYNRKIYVNGILEQNWTSAYLPTFNNDLKFGERGDGSGSLFGKLDEVGIWDKVLTQTEINTLYNSGNGYNPVTENDTGILNGCVSYKSFDGNAIDSILRNNNGIMDSPVLTPGKIGQCYEFDGADDYIDLGNMGSHDIITINFWAYFNVWVSSASEARNLFTTKERPSGVLADDIRFENYDNKLTLVIEDGATFEQIDTSLTSSDVLNKFNQFTISFNRLTRAYNIYFNAVEILSGNSTLTPTTSWLSQFLIGVGYDIDNSTTRYFDGKIDEVGIWDRVLTQTEINTLYNSGNGYDPVANNDTGILNGCISYYNFNNNANDGVGSNNGTLSGPTLTNGKIGQCYEFDGTDSITINKPVSSLDYSISLWVETSKTTSEFVLDTVLSGVVSKRTWLELNRVVSGDVAFVQRNEANDAWNILVTDNVNISNGAFNHITITKEGTIGKIYVNGTLVKTDTVYDITLCDSNYNYGKNADSSVVNYVGKLDEVGIWNKVLTQDEITTLYNSGNGYNPTIPIEFPTDGLISYYNFDNGVSDAFGSNDGTNYGTTEVVGKIGQCYEFDGTNYMNVTAPSVNNTFSISAWVYLTDVTTEQQIISSETSVYEGCLLAGSNLIGFVAHGSNNYVNTSATLSTNTWYHVTCVSNGYESKIYLNGVLQNTLTNSNLGTLSTDLLIGKRTGDTLYFTGKIDEVGIWDRALTQTEITTLYNSGNGLQYNPTN